MDKNIFTMILLCSLTGCAIENHDPGDYVENFDSSRQELAKDSQLTPATLSWTLDSIESCQDTFLGPCTSTQPSGQCPSVVAGQPCSASDLICTKVIGSSWKTFICQ